MDTQREYDTQRIYMVLDRIAHHSTTGTDLDNTAAGLRRLLSGAMPSDVLRKRPAKKKSSDATLRATITNLREKLAQVENENAEYQRDLSCMEQQIAKLQSQLEQSPVQERSHDFHTYDEVLQAMVMKFGKHHGVPAALFERNTQLLQQGVTSDKITSSVFQQWRKDNRFPPYVIEQIEAMTPGDFLSRGKWTTDERQYLVELYSIDPSQTNKAIAAACSTKFGRLVTECAIKGELNRLRVEGKVSKYRSH